MRAVIYVPTSGLGQVDREGPGVQEADGCRYATACGMTVVAVLHEAAVTGETDDRPAYAEALVMVEQGEADCIIVATRSRLARNLMVQEALLRRAWTSVLRSTKRTTASSRRTTPTTRPARSSGRCSVPSPHSTRP